MIVPTIGRVLWYYPATDHTEQNQAQPVLVCHVHNDRLVNVGGFNSYGTYFGATSVQLLQDDDVAAEGVPHVRWMPYQTTQAAKAPA